MKVNYDRAGNDVLQMLVPFVADCARKYREPLSDESIQIDLKDTFGLPVPRTVVKSILRRLSKAGALKREYGVYIPVRGEIEKSEYDLSSRLNDVHRSQMALIRGGIEFALRVFEYEVQDAEFSQALSLLARQQVTPLSIWAIKGEPAVIPDTSGNKNPDKVAHIAAQFVLHVINDGTADERTALAQVAKGSLLSGVLWSANLDAPDRRIDGLEFFLDTTFLLRVLGLCGPTRASYSHELTSMARESGIALVCFEHNRREIIGILSAASSILSSGRTRYFGEAVEFMVSQGWEASDVEEAILTLDNRLSECGVEVREKPAREPRFNMDEAKLRDLLDSTVRYTSSAALDKDIDSLASIFVMRRARYTDWLESSRALFVTTNNNLAIASRQLYKVGEDGFRGLPLALVDSQVASYLWARNSGAADDLPLNLLAMGALAIAESEPRTWLRYVDKIDELRSRERISERDYVLLRQSLLARSILLASTEGNADAFTEDKAVFVLKHSLAEYERELQETVERREEELAFRTAELAFSESRAEDAESARIAMGVAQSDAFAQAALRSARRVVYIVGGCIAFLVFAAAAISFPWPIDRPLGAALPTWASASLGVIAVVIGSLSIVVGSTVFGAGQLLISRIAKVLENRYRQKFSSVADD